MTFDIPIKMFITGNSSAEFIYFIRARAKPDTLYRPDGILEYCNFDDGKIKYKKRNPTSKLIQAEFRDIIGWGEI